ncbi:MAG: hypothetical protein QG597_1638, partial [Actinomycetota bacterium]|nr:hypothetical protein [Actinomycetota bacterium]
MCNAVARLLSTAGCGGGSVRTYPARSDTVASSAARVSSLAIGTAAGTSATTAHPRPVLGAAFADLAAPTVADPPKAQIGQEPPFPEDAPDTTEPHKVQRYEVCTINGGRELAVQSFGAADGVPIVFMHGMPGSRIGPYPRAAALDLQGIRLIAYDRPGYGRSTRNKGRSVADAADDVESIANTLGLDQFAVVGRSGGGPHALAVAARLPHLVTAAAVLVSTAPPESPSLDWVDGMNRANAEAYTQVEDHTQLRRKLSSTVERTLKDPESFLHEWVIPQISHNDWPVIEDLEIRRQLRASYLEAFRNGVDGWFDDILALRSKW